ncbi:50S ribosomal protein L11 methyltransferase [Parathalassolituus penaei]|uniref:Ribosomal protein L11 methyltransferase n=1 Tax=Parathalassolituus penaei TaxID=2997323 RepID=A0A9X3EB25_9GAMM|nr:50S ribosomal protein L11 methyltransferase [Parathalassolituus penaei]MCY0964274.1 50S ribosomal protein L11 methyltransferase [Parathalassolituus penaei]
MSQWVQLRIHTEADQVEACENALLGLGAVSVTLQDNADQPILEPALGTTPLWDKTQVIGLFDAAVDSNALLAEFPALFELEGGTELPHLQFELVEDKDWIRAWMDDYQPMQFGPRLWVCPSWREPPQADAVNLLLDPGLAFGTGTHPTTALCLSWLDEVVKGGEHVVDFGCGSGILGIAALLLGAKDMTGIDIDPQALLATRDNAGRNHIDEARYDVFLPENTPDVQGDILVANILAGPLHDLAPQLAALTRSGGKLALSGLLREQAEGLITRYSEWFVIDSPRFREDWVIISGTRK